MLCHRQGPVATTLLPKTTRQCHITPTATKRAAVSIKTNLGFPGATRGWRGQGRRTVQCACAGAPRTYYNVLGLRDSASRQDIKDAFRRLAMVWHPDKCMQPGAKETFLELKQAYETLSDDASRQQYDTQLRQARSVHAAPAVSTGAGGRAQVDWAKARAAAGVRSGSSKSSTARRTGSAARTFSPRTASTAGSAAWGAASAAPPRPAQGWTHSAGGSAGCPPRPPTPRAAAGDDFEMFTRLGSAATPSGATSYVRAPSAAVGTSYRSIFGGQASAQPYRSGAYATAASPFAARATAAGSRAQSTRNPSPRAGSSPPRGARSVPPPLTAAQQWHADHAHTGDDFAAATAAGRGPTAAGRGSRVLPAAQQLGTIGYHALNRATSYLERSAGASAAGSGGGAIDTEVAAGIGGGGGSGRFCSFAGQEGGSAAGGGGSFSHSASRFFDSVVSGGGDGAYAPAAAAVASAAAADTPPA